MPQAVQGGAGQQSIAGKRVVPLIEVEVAGDDGGGLNAEGCHTNRKTGGLTLPQGQ